MLKNEVYLARGARTKIRRFTRPDVDEWVSWPRHADPLFRDYNSPDLKPHERDIWYSERLARNDHSMYAITDLEGRLIGRLFLRQIDRVQRSAVLGVDLRSDMLSEGLGTDALRAFNDYFFKTRGYEILKLDVAAYNYRAQRVYEKLGWAYTGERWPIYPSIFAQEVFTDPRYEPLRRFFRRGPGTVSVLHLDMELSRERWLRGSLDEG
jgi:RimJ/RimL family protein N-acetyltransferase